MYRYDVFQDGRAVGSAEVQSDGLYWSVRVRCAPLQGIVRVRAENIMQGLTIGVLTPQADSLMLTRKIARSSFAFFPDTCLTLDSEPRWQNFTQRAAGWPLDGARVCRADGGATVLVPAQEAKPFVCMPLFCFFRLVTREQTRYWMLELDGENNPVMPNNRPES